MNIGKGMRKVEKLQRIFRDIEPYADFMVYCIAKNSSTNVAEISKGFSRSEALWFIQAIINRFSFSIPELQNVIQELDDRRKRAKEQTLTSLQDLQRKHYEHRQ